MSLARIARLHASFTALVPQLDAIVGDSFDHLLAGHPELRALFGPNLARQTTHFASAMALVMRNVADLPELEPALAVLGQRYADHGVRPEFYPVLRDALLRAIERAAKGMGEAAWNEQLEADWFWAINSMTAAMLGGATRPALGILEEMRMARPPGRGGGPGRADGTGTEAAEPITRA